MSFYGLFFESAVKLQALGEIILVNHTSIKQVAPQIRSPHKQFILAHFFGGNIDILGMEVW